PLHRDERLYLGDPSPDRRVGRELVRPPADLDPVAVVEGLQGLREAPLADVAPGAGDVGPDLDVGCGEKYVRHAHIRVQPGPDVLCSRPIGPRTRQLSSAASREISTPVSALLTGHPAFASSAALTKPSASRPSTSPRTFNRI